MAQASLLKATCAAAMLAATPVLAQTNNPTGDTGPGGTPNMPATHEAMPMNGSSHMTGHTHHSTMGMHHARGHQAADAQNAAVDRLNEESYQAAQRGAAFGSGDATAPAGATGGTNDLSAPRSTGGKM